MTDKEIISKIKFDDKGLVPAIAVDCQTNSVLMQAFMNKEALELTLSTGQAHYYSRSRKSLWKKGETSGNFQHVVQIIADCDFDSIVVRVNQTGVACHTGSRSCFYNDLKTFENVANVDVAYDVINVINDRRNNPEEGSYTNYLLNKGNEKICKKVGEEASECIIAAMKQDKNELACELADLFYHATVLMVNNGIDYSDVLKILDERKNAPRKVMREKNTSI